MRACNRKSIAEKLRDGGSREGVDVFWVVSFRNPASPLSKRTYSSFNFVRKLRLKLGRVRAADAVMKWRWANMHSMPG